MRDSLHSAIMMAAQTVRPGSSWVPQTHWNPAWNVNHAGRLYLAPVTTLTYSVMRKPQSLTLLRVWHMLTDAPICAWVLNGCYVLLEDIISILSKLGVQDFIAELEDGNRQCLGPAPTLETMSQSRLFSTTCQSQHKCRRWPTR